MVAKHDALLPNRCPASCATGLTTGIGQPCRCCRQLPDRHTVARLVLIESGTGASSAPINTAISERMAAMATQALDDLTDDERVAVHRARAATMLTEINRQAKQTLVDAGIDLDLFFLIPNSGEAIITFGTSGDPSDDQWGRVADVVSSVVRQSVGLDRSRCQEVICATTDDLRQPAGADAYADCAASGADR